MILQATPCCHVCSFNCHSRAQSLVNTYTPVWHQTKLRKLNTKAGRRYRHSSVDIVTMLWAGWYMYWGSISLFRSLLFCSSKGGGCNAYRAKSWPLTLYLVPRWRISVPSTKPLFGTGVLSKQRNNFTFKKKTPWLSSANTSGYQYEISYLNKQTNIYTYI
jgi:hypothetical protein